MRLADSNTRRAVPTWVARVIGFVVTLTLLTSCGGGSPATQANRQSLAPSDAVSGTGVAAQLQAVTSLQCLIFGSACDQAAGAPAGLITQVQDCTIPAGGFSCTATVSYITARAANPMLVFNGNTVLTGTSVVALSVQVAAEGGELQLRDGANVLDQRHIAPSLSVTPTISALDQTTAAPFASLTITGGGFSPTNSVISVRFTPADGSGALTIPTTSASSNSVTVPTPGFFDPTTGVSASKTVGVEVIQYTNGTINVSNTITGLQVSALSPMPAGTTVGALTDAFLRSGIGMSAATQSSIASRVGLSTLSSALIAKNTDLTAVVAALDSLIQHPGASATVTLLSGRQLILTPSVLAATDQIIQAYLASAAAVINSTSASSPNTTQPMASSGAAAEISAATTVLLRSAVPQSAVACPTQPTALPAPTHPPAAPPPPPPQITNVGSDNSINLTRFTNFYQNLSGANPAISAKMKVLGVKLAAEVVLGETMEELGNLSSVPTAFALAWDGVVSVSASRLVTGEAPDGAEMFSGARGTLLEEFVHQITKADLHGSIGLITDTAEILYMAATIDPPSNLISAGIGWGFAFPQGDTEIVVSTGNQTIRTPVTPGSYSSTDLVTSSPLDCISGTSAFALTVSKTGTGTGTLTSSPGGISCGSNCSASFSSGSQVTLTASPDTGSTFAGWSGACSGTGACIVTLNSATTVAATFTLVPPQTFTLSTFAAGTGNGTILSTNVGTSCGTGCASYPSGSVVQLTASANAGSSFSGWTGACSGTGVCAITMTSNQSVTANFTLNITNDDWYYHWNCHGDASCISTNPSGTSSGTVDEGPGTGGLASCNGLLTFASHFWGAAATNSCDHSPT